MTPLVATLLAALAVWLLACLYYGFRMRFVAFLAVLTGGLALNLGWMVLGLNARPFEPHALVAQAALAAYGVCTFALGLLVGRVVRQWRATGVDTGKL